MGLSRFFPCTLKFLPSGFPPRAVTKSVSPGMLDAMQSWEKICSMRLEPWLRHLNTMSGLEFFPLREF